MLVRDHVEREREREEIGERRERERRCNTVEKIIQYILLLVEQPDNQCMSASNNPEFFLQALRNVNCILLHLFHFVSFGLFGLVWFGLVWFGLVWFRAASRRVASRRVASRRVASRRVASRRVASRRVASFRFVSFRFVSFLFVSFHFISACPPRTPLKVFGYLGEHQPPFRTPMLLNDVH